jgi:ribosomal protein L11 methyltransferase
MDWIEVSVRGVDGEAAEALSEIMTRYGQGGAVLEHILATPQSTGWVEQSLIVKTYVPATPVGEGMMQKLREAIWHLSVIYPMPEPEVRYLAHTDWAEAWKQHYVPIKPGERLVIVPAWEERPVEQDQLPIYINPGMAFGTGTHPSTQLCLILMEKHLRAGDSVFDVGTGSGILGVAAARLGAETIAASDSDPVAVEAAIENATLNNLQGTIEVARGSVDAFEGPFDLIVINILAEVIVQLLPDALVRLAPGGRIVLAGIILERESLVQDRLSELGLLVLERQNQADWIGLVVTRPAA